MSWSTSRRRVRQHCAMSRLHLCSPSLKRLPQTKSQPALLRCYQIAFPIHEEFGCCNMRTFGVFRPLWARFLRSTGTFTQGAQANLPGQREQGLSHRSETHAAKDSPFMLRNGDHHPCIGGGEFVRHIVERDVVLNDGFTMNASQSRQHYRHHIVGNKRETKTE